jgi:ADP-L-glycero-D-manno-heptose 6-epimerase
VSRRLILVTGGAGFIGANIVARLTEDPALDVAVCDRLRASDSGKWRNLVKHPIADIFPPGDLWDWLEGRGKDVDLVIHMGAISSTVESDADLILGTNFGLSRDLFRWCAEHGRRFIYASSAATYGDGALGFEDRDERPFLTALRPLNPYGWSKALFDIFAVRQAERGAAPPRWAGLKFFNVYGPGEGHKGTMASVAARIWPDVAAGRPVKLFKSHDPAYGDGCQMRDFVYVRDAAEVVAWLAGAEAQNGVYNLGSGLPRTFRALAEAVFKAAGQPPRIDYVDMPQALRGQYQYFTEGRIDRLRAAGWTGPATGLEEGIADYVGRYLSRVDPHP